ncbi:hypothetical protein [Congregibacter litoralis]|uniref:Uncharacterized protein n=1 Tax=Congregibacter litoralis KT71 TaxID=314285 RepID=A4A795_9GAMM|nr:hypothetical protein [Congregibacter litoralis]EAQ98164.1 hypothetical protein KT71_02917 [Congregibacter litoralis KT71]
MLRLLRHSAVLITLVTLLASNVLLLTSSAFNAAISTALATTLGVRTASAALSTRLAGSERQLQTLKRTQLRRSASVKGFGRSLTARTKRVAARGIAAIPAESLPYIGAAVVVSSMVYELYEACETLRELDTLYTDLGLAETVPDDAMRSLCNPPPLDELFGNPLSQPDV